MQSDCYINIEAKDENLCKAFGNNARLRNDSDCEENNTSETRTSSRSLFMQASSIDLDQITDSKLRLLNLLRLARSICGNCHIRGHRADDNRRNDSCNLPPCTSYYLCGQRKKHPEHFDKIRNSKKQLNDIIKEMKVLNWKRKRLSHFSPKAFRHFLQL